MLLITSRLLILVIGWLSTLVIPPGPHSGTSTSLIGNFIRWDANWFLSIAENGYSYVPGEWSSIAFFPLFPMVVRVLGQAFGHVAASILWANLCLAIAVIMLWKFSDSLEEKLPGAQRSDHGLLAVALLLFGPVSFFFSIPYSESLFLSLSLLSLYAANRRLWLIAGLAGFAAALTRNAGVLLVAPLLIEYFNLRLQRPWIDREVSVWRSWPCLLPVLGLLTWSAYLAFRFGDPFLVFRVQAAWGRELTSPVISLFREFFREEVFYSYWFIGFTLAASVILLFMIKARMRLSLTAYAGLSLLLYTSAGHLESIPRLLSVVFPFYLALAQWAAGRLEWSLALIASSSALLVVSVILFVNGYWFT